MSHFGSSSLPLMLAGHPEVQRPHSVQLYVSKRSFQLKSLRLPTPKVSASSRFTVWNWPLGLCEAKKTLKGAAMMCRCLEYGRDTRKLKRSTAWSHHDTWKKALTAPARRSASTPARALPPNCPRADGTGASAILP